MTKNNINKNAGDELRKLRLNTGCSIYKVAKAVHISGNYLSEIERGEKEPSDIVLESLASFYKIPHAELFVLYNRITPTEAVIINSNPHLRKLLTQISLDKRISDEERNNIYIELGKLYQKFIDRYKGDND